MENTSRPRRLQPAVVYPNLVIGIDGGGSHTVALLAERLDDGRIIGKGQAGPSNIQSVGVERAVAALGDAVNLAFLAARLPRGTAASAALGLAGVDHSSPPSLFAVNANGLA